MKSLKGFAAGTAAPSRVKIREIARAGVQGSWPTRNMYTGHEPVTGRNRKKPDENRLKSGRDKISRAAK